MTNQPKDDLVPELKNIARAGAGVPPKETNQPEETWSSCKCGAEREGTPQDNEQAICPDCNRTGCYVLADDQPKDPKKPVVMEAMKCTCCSYEDLPTREQDDQPDNGAGKEYASYLKVEFPGEEPVYYSDAMEPEDVRFYRDLSWISVVILAAYQAGKSVPTEINVDVAERDRLKESHAELLETLKKVNEWFTNESAEPWATEQEDQEAQRIEKVITAAIAKAGGQDVKN